MMKPITTLMILGILDVAAVQVTAADAFLVKDGQPRAEIVIAENPPRTTRLAAQELQTYVEKISGARAVIVPGGTHMAFAEKPGEVNAAIDEFLQGLQSG